MSKTYTHLSRRAFLGGAVVFGAAALWSPANAFADPTAAEKRAEADAALAKLNTMREKLQEDAMNYERALDAHDAAVAKMDEAQAKIDANNVEIARLQDHLGTRARSMYRTGQTSFLDLLFGSATFEEFAQNWDILQKMNQDDADAVEQTKALRADNEAQKEEYAAQEKIAAEQLAESERILAESKALAEEYQAAYDSLDAEAQALFEEEQRAAAEAEAERQRKEWEEQQNNSGNNGGDTGSGGGETDSGNDNGGGSGGGYIPPSGSVVDYAISQLGVRYDQTNPQVPNDHFDCSGLCQWCWLQATGINIGRTTWTQKASANWCGSLSEAQPGDVLYTDGHVGICTQAGGGEYIHAPTWGQTVSYSSWSQFYCALRW